MQTLVVIEGLVKAGNTVVAAHFSKELGCVQRQLGAAQGSVKEKVRHLAIT